MLHVKRYLALLLALPAVLFLVSCATPQASHGAIARAAFRNSVDTPPAGWRGPVFQLSDSYPKTKPNCDAPWLKRDVNFQDPNPQWQEWEPYIQDIVNYVKEGQDPN